MHAAFTPSTVLLGSAVAVCAVVLLLLLPASRRRLANLWMQISGWFDAKLLRSHHESLVVVAVTRKLAGIKLRTEAWFAHALRAARPWFAKLGAAYNRALTEWESAQRRLAEAEQEAAVNGVSSDTGMRSFLHISGPQYYAAQVLLGCGEAGLTYLSFQLWHLSPQVLLVAVVGFGLLGGVIGHMCGQAISRRQRGFAWLLCGVGLLYCCILGAMRYAFLMQNADAGGGSLTNLLGSFGWPSVCMALSVALGSQLRHATPLEQARIDESRAKTRCADLDQRGFAAAKGLRDAFEARALSMTTLMDAYRRGFSFGWSRRDPIAFPDQAIAVPYAELEALWPPSRWTGAAPPPSAVRTISSRNGAADHPLVRK